MNEGNIENLGSNGDAGVESSGDNFFKAWFLIQRIKEQWEN
jgi:hypothetical protein